MIIISFIHNNYSWITLTLSIDIYSYNYVLIKHYYVQSPQCSIIILLQWTTLLSWIVVVNNSVEPCLKDQDSIYQATDGVKESTFKAYHAGYSANIGMCEGMEACSYMHRCL